MLDLNDLYLFASVVKHSGFSPAARAMGVPKSRLSKHVAGLERRLGVRLIERSTRRFRVTETGEALYQQCAAVVASAEAAEALMASARSEPRGVVRVSCPPGLARHLEVILPGFLADYPLVRLEMSLINRMVDIIEERIDVAIRVRQKLDADPMLTMRVLGSARAILVASPSFAERNCRGLEVTEVGRLSTLVQAEMTGRDTMTLVGPGGRQIEVVHQPRLSFGDFEVLRRLAISGLGVALLPIFMCEGDFAEGTLEHVFPAWATPEATIHAVFTTRHGLPPAVRAFIDRLARDFPSNLDRPPTRLNAA
jgi:DNA-binding transcriptional LysR family regulator